MLRLTIRYYYTEQDGYSAQEAVSTLAHAVDAARAVLSDPASPFKGAAIYQGRRPRRIIERAGGGWMVYTPSKVAQNQAMDDYR